VVDELVAAVVGELVVALVVLNHIARIPML